MHLHVCICKYLHVTTECIYVILYKNLFLYKNPGLEGIKKIYAFINGIGLTLPKKVSAEMAPNLNSVG